MKKLNACDLSDMIEQEFGFQFNIPHLVMEDQKLIEVSISSEKIDDQRLNELKAYMDHMEKSLPWSLYTGPQIYLSWEMEALLDHLCFLKKLEEGEYLVAFDD